ncbi:inositol phospholipid biosynthesis protein Scs3 [Histoplasma capsulatum var. duboisii H88]|uniref:Acyl-coenzyme A diphosphatase SCS3 n=1 Tax=Ajellomyces capsulatus (strain H88) TaxID=544711 RepID=F0U968_AJEC8|nr:inositol phospholipid biosynthesis protein Scs3 [Histoplasma capsulatum var. duboisii H88]QSS52547.1 inositol phospholipid biosynthesis protein Scs3 [Histoplasma capsulatum var. duboisii H88]
MSSTNAVRLNGSARKSSSAGPTSSRPLLPPPPPLSLALYPLTLLLGSLFSLISPTARPPANTSSSPGVTPNSDTSPVNYFARKGNIFNVYFVKVGWLWTTLAFLSLLLTQPAFNNRLLPPAARLKRVGRAICRYILVTIAWLLTTQWFFGPGIIDRSFIATGGKCESSIETGSGGSISELAVILTATACKASGGAWTGGHDVSGHVFMLVLTSAFLLLELQGASSVESEMEEPKDRNQYFVQMKLVEKWSRNFTLAVGGLSWWMLLMTAIWFHTWLEKVTGLTLALGAVYTIYFLPRTLSPWRNIVGIPGG